MRGCFGAAFAPAILLLSACGSGSPTAPMTVEAPLAPIVVTLTAEVVNQTLSLRTFGERRGGTDRGFVDRRNVRVTGTVNVSGGSATLAAAVTLTHAIGGANPPSPIVRSIFTSR